MTSTALPTGPASAPPRSSIEKSSTVDSDPTAWGSGTSNLAAMKASIARAVGNLLRLGLTRPTIGCIEQTVHYSRPTSIKGLMTLELTSTDWFGLFEVCTSGSPIEDEQKLDTIGVILRNVLKADNDIRSARTSVSLDEIHTERRLHQLMFFDRDYERKVVARPGSGPSVSVRNHVEKDYSVVNIQCRDLNKL
ncbi:ACT domain-containing family protein [Striga asiatica]|uniref:ACT domain-containing protein ACR n=1 Tax=Striga asiatica TaxID=4170 RepID=A0A5A7PPJ8_STRAF|nr:ACT domain-containing family protein [Striga asiatica]